MSSKIRRILAGVLSVIMILSLAACGGGTDTNTNTNTDTNANPAEQGNEPEDIVNIKSMNIYKILKEQKVDKKIQLLTWNDIDETSGEVEVFKSVYGVPEAGSTKYGADFSDRVFVYTAAPYAQRYSKLATMINSGNSPDIFPFERYGFPYGVYKNLFKSIDGIVDTNSAEWADTRVLMDQYLLGGKNYTAITESSVGNVLWYQKSVVEKAGIDDPYQLYKDGNWTWDTFLKLAEDFKASGEEKYIIDGNSVEDDLLGSTGTPLVGIDKGKLVLNSSTDAFNRVNEFLLTLSTNDYRYPRHIKNGFRVDYDAWYDGSTLFFSDGTWRYEETWQKRVQKNKLKSADDIWFVPWPKDTKSDNYYQLMSHDSYMLCSGSQNDAGYKAWVYCCLYVVYTPEYSERQREKRKIDYNWTEEQLDFIDELKETFVTTARFDFKNGLGYEHFIACGENPVSALFDDIYLSGEPIDSGYIKSIQGMVDNINEKLSLT